MNDFNSIWERITRLAGAEFHTKTGKPFSYDIAGNAVALRNTPRSLPRSHFQRALDRAPLTGPGQLQDLQGPSYLFAILTDPRVSSSGSVAQAPVTCHRGRRRRHRSRVERSPQHPVWPRGATARWYRSRS